MRKSGIGWVVLSVLLAAPAGAQVVDLSVSGPSGTAVKWAGPTANAHGGAVVQRGDLNGDINRLDLLVGAPGGGASGQGQVFGVFIGPPKSGVVSLSTADVIFTGENAGDLFGSAIEVGAITRSEAAGPQPRDVLIGAPNWSGGRGAAYVFRGTFVTGQRLAAGSALLRVVGAPADQLGSAVAVGDLDGDGYRDIVLAAPGTGRIYVIWGGPTLGGQIDLSAASPSITILTGAPGPISLAMRDITGDGLADLAIGLPQTSPFGLTQAGSVYVVTGKARASLTTTISLDSQSDMLFSGIQPGDHAGASLTIPDIDGDRVGDLTVGAPDAAGPSGSRPGAGSVYVMWGGASLSTRSLSAADVTIYGAAAGYRTGAAMTFGDIRRDIPNDLALLAPGASSAGEIHVVYGHVRSTMPAVIDLANGMDRRLRADPAGGAITSVTVLEVTGEGAGDIVAGAPNASDSGNAGAGLVFCVYSPTFGTNPGSVSLTAAQGASARTTFQLLNIGTTSQSFAARSNASWLSITPSSGSTSATLPATVTVTASPGSLPVGVYQGAVVMASNSYDLDYGVQVNVTLTVTPGTPGGGGGLNVFGLPPSPDEGSPAGVVTAVGTNVTVVPVRDVLVSFANVTVAGVTKVDITSSVTEQPLGPGLRYGPWIYRVSTTAQFSGPITIAVAYGDFALAGHGAFRIVRETNEVNDRADHSRKIAWGTTTSLGGRFSLVWRDSPGDYDFDSRADGAVWRPSSGMWYVRQSGTLTGIGLQWGSGAAGDVPVPGDYDGDGKVDAAVWRGSTGMWFILKSSNGFDRTQAVGIQWGSQPAGDIPVPGDYDGDGKTDIAVWRPSTGTWFILKSSDNYNRSTALVIQWGAGVAGDIPVPADYDGDGATDIAVWRASTGMWYVLKSSGNFSRSSYAAMQWGSAGDIPVPADYDGDGKADIAVWRPSSQTWYILKSNDNYNRMTATAFQWGSLSEGDIPVPGDYDGDGKADIAVWRPASGNWYVARSKDNYGSLLTWQWGTSQLGDVVPGAPRH